MRVLFLILLVSLIGMIAVCAASDMPLLQPIPKDLDFLAEKPVVLDGSVAIVIGSAATEPEEYAAETLQKFVKKRYGREWPVIRDNADLKSYGALMILGQALTNKLVNSVCRDLKINASQKFPIPDGYVLGVGKSGGKSVAVVAGSNPRSVIYGQDTLFQLMRADGNGIALWPAMIKDWPSLQHRGRPCTSAEYASSIDVLDAAALGRLNFIDIRYGIYGTNHSAKLNHDKIKLAVKEAHRRGILVYGTVSLVAEEVDYDKVIAKFQEFIDLGVDGLWPYIGDPGGYGRGGTPFDLIKRVLDLGKKHGMTGDLIHFTPGKRGYVNIDNPDNFTAAKIPGMDQVLWFFATKPTPESDAQAAQLGLKKKYVWWDHWPHPRGGFSSCGNVGMRPDGSNIFANLHALQDAYQRPQPEELELAPEFVSGVIPWGGTIWLQETILGPIGWWAWAPETHDWQRTRRRIYDYLYGPDLVKTAFQFNDLYEELRRKNVMCDDDYERAPKEYLWPPLKREGVTTAECLDLINRMRAPLEKLRNEAVRGTMLDQATLEKYYFEPADKELASAEVVVSAPRVDYWWRQNEERILIAVREGNTEQALRWQADAEKRAFADTAEAETELVGVINNINLQSKWARKFERLAGSAAYTGSAITVDGVIDEPAWSSTEILGPFRVCNDSQTTETLSTAKVLYGDDALYVAFEFGEPNMDLLVATNTQHDAGVWGEDSFELYINTDGLRLPFYKFTANAIGTKSETVQSADGIDDAWNGEWEVKTARNAGGWSAEARIPYSTLGVSKPQANDMWLCNFGRNDRATDKRLEQNEDAFEMSAWGYKPRGRLHDAEKFRPLWFK